MQFVLPMQNSELLNSSGNSYCVQKVYPLGEIEDRLRECKRALMHSDPFYVLDHFDTYFSLMECNNNESSVMTNLMRSFDLLYLTVDKLGENLTAVLSGNEAQSVHRRSDYLNLVKMCMFLLVNVVKKIDTIVHRIQQEQQQPTMQKKRGKQAHMLEQYPNWDSKRAKFLIQLYNIMQLPLEKLWSPPVPEENFVNLLCDICYRTLEIVRAGDHSGVVDTIFQIFGTAIKRYNHAMTFPVRILQILRTSEHSASAIASGIHLLHEEYNITSIFSMLIKDIVDSLTIEMSDTVVSRNFSNFLIELATVSPKLMIPHLSTLGDELLNCESHILRNCILQIMGDAIVGELTSEELSEDLKEARNDFLESLLEHVNDVSAHVRSKVLQIWNRLKEENAVPLSFQFKVLSGAVDRLEDKTSTVRRHAIQLIKSFLECNPYAAKLSMEELIKKHEEECAKMEQLTEVLAEERKKAEALEEQWNNVIPDILPFVEQMVDENTENTGGTEDNYENLVARISGLLVQKQYKEAVALIRKADYAAGNSDLRLTLKRDEQCAYYMALLKSYIFLANGCKDSNEELGTQIKTVQFLQDSIEFAKVASKAMPKIREMLLSKTNTDVFEAVDLFTTGYLFGIKGTELGMRQMLYLVWSSDKEKRDAVSNAYKKVLFGTDQAGRAHAVKVVNNLMRFLQELNYGHYTALECLIREWVQSNDIDPTIIQVLFERFTLKLEGTTENESRLSLQLLIMASTAKSSIASANVTVIESIGMGERAKSDPRVFTSCLEFLMNSIDYSTNSKFYKRYEPTSALVQKVENYLQRFFFHPRIPDFDRLAMRSLEFFYQMCQTPDVICQKVLIELLKKLRVFAMRLCEITPSQTALAEETPFSQPIPDTQPGQSATTLAEADNASAVVGGELSQMRMPVFLLTRLIFLVGYMTMKEMIFLDIDVYNNMKYRQELTECEQKKKKKTAFDHLKRRTNVLNMSATESLKRLSGSAAEPQQEPDEDLVGATAEDNIAELINHICEDVLLFNDAALLAKLCPYILEICKYPIKYKNQQLQQAATLALIRFMCVSSKFCEAHMPFLMNILNHTKNIKIKCNIVIGLSDLTFRFPNIIEPWTGHFYSTLHEKNTELRLTAVKMLSHLILHEMIRVKGQIADLAMCIVDADDEIKNITQQFFKEIANKSNILYNVLPDIISKLGDTSLNLEEEKYRNIMRYILGLIHKDRQVETLVEKLCLRFQVTREERQWRDVAYCLSLLSYNERTIKKLIDHVHTFKDKVQVDEVYQSFKLIITNTSKMAKPELKALLTELEKRINECLEVPDEHAQTKGPPSTFSKKTTRSRAKSSSKAKGRARLHERSSSESANEQAAASSSSSSASSAEEDEADEGRKAAPPTTQKKAAGRRRKPVAPSPPPTNSSDDDEDNEGEGEGESSEATKRANRTTRANTTTTDNNTRSNRARSRVIQETPSSDEANVPERKRGRRGRK